MNFLKRAWLATKAKRGRSLLLTLVTTAILVFVLAGITIHNASQAAVASAKKQTGSTISLQLNRNYMMSQMKPPTSGASNSSEGHEMPSIPLATAQKLAKQSGISGYLFSTTTVANASQGIKAISTSSTENSTESSSQAGHQGPQMASGDFTVTGVSETAKVSEFKSSTNRISKGVGITSKTADNAAVISSDLAKSNSLSVGDSFTLTQTVNNKTVKKTLVVVGIYTSKSTANSAQLQSSSSNPQNNIYTTVATANAFKGSEDSIDSATYTVSNPAKLKRLVKTMKSSINTKKYSLVSSDEMYQQMLQPLNNIATIARYIIVLVSIAGAVILTLMTMLSIRERRYEIGVLMSLGENRMKIIAQFFMELLIVTLVSLSLASLAGNYVGNVLGDQLLSSTNTHQTQQMPNQNRKDSKSNDPSQGTPPNQGNAPHGDMMSMVKPSEMSQQLNIVMKGNDVAKLGGIAIMISFVATCLASVGILKMKPKDILTSH